MSEGLSGLAPFIKCCNRQIFLSRCFSYALDVICQCGSVLFCVSMWSINRTVGSAVYPVVDIVRSRHNREREHTQLAEIQVLTTCNHVYSSQGDGIALMSLSNAKSTIVSDKRATSTSQFATPRDMTCGGCCY